MAGWIKSAKRHGDEKDKSQRKGMSNYRHLAAASQPAHPMSDVVSKTGEKTRAKHRYRSR